MTVGMIIGAALTIAGANAVFTGHPLSQQGAVVDLITGGLMFTAGVAIFLWGVRPARE